MKLLLLITLIGYSTTKPLEKETKCGYQACGETDFTKLNVHIVAHSHDDVGWLKTVDQYYYDSVDHVIESVIVSLQQNPERKFIQVETAFFKKWWEKQNEKTQNSVRDLINNGQLEITGGGWSMNDEAAVLYPSTIDQYSTGLRYIQDQLGDCARSRITWQIDPFGHSREQASISTRLGNDGFIFVRIDYRDKNHRKENKTMDLLWKGSANLDNPYIFSSILNEHYSAPNNFCFDIDCNDEPIIDDPDSPDYNYEQRLEEFVNFVNDRAKFYPTNNILITFGDDFRYKAALNTFINLDLLINGFKKFDHGINVFYSTPACYTKAVNDYVNEFGLILENKQDDFMPYSDGPNSVWSGYFTSRPASKRFERIGNNILQVTKQLGALGQLGYNDTGIKKLREAMGVMQHHDAITGTEKQAVTNSYHLFLYNAIESAIDTADTVLSAFITGKQNGETLGLETCLLANITHCAQSKADKFTVVVYNPLSQSASSFINLPVDYENYQIIDPDEQEVSYQISSILRNFDYIPDIQCASNYLTFEATDLPPLGYKVYRIEKIAEKIKPKQEIPKNKSLKYGFEKNSFEIDDNGFLKSVTLNGVTQEIKQEFLHYSSHDQSGAYIFDPFEDSLTPFAEKAEITEISGDLFVGVLQKFCDFGYQIIKIYKNRPNYIEFDWSIGPLTIGERGVEVISRFTTEFKTESLFYTDSNGRELLERKRNFRPDYQYEDSEPEAGNYYPINNRILIRDQEEQIELAILTDRSQGGTSLVDGQLDIMVHRACHNDDGRGVGENLNEQQYDQGLVIRGQHLLVLGKIEGDGQKSLAAIERELAQQLILTPWVFITDKNVDDQLKSLSNAGIKQSLNDQVHILTLEPWNENELLLRLEHILENDEDENLAKEVIVDLSDLSDKFTINEIIETTIDGNVKIEDVNRLVWPLPDGKKTNATLSKSLSDDGFSVKLAPIDIRTFVLKVTYK